MRKSRLAGFLSTLFMGLGQVVVNKEYIKGLIFAAVELIALLNFKLISSGLIGFVTLGTVTGYSETMTRYNDHSIFMLLRGIITLFIMGFFAIIYISNIRDAFSVGKRLEKGGKSQTFSEFMKEFWDKSFPYIMSIPALVGTVFFIALPMVFAVLIAFTNYSSPDHIPPKSLVDWVGFSNFSQILRLKAWSATFVGVFSWTAIWAVSATFMNFFGGLFVALLINSKEVKMKKLWRTIYILPYAVPQLISLLIFRNLFNGQFGPINETLKFIGVIHPYFGVLKSEVAWLSDPAIARFTVVIINLWLGFPYFMALLTGVMTSIGEELYEASTIDGATKIQQFMNITLPLVIQATTPLIIMSFSFNFNNFGAVFFLTEGGPTGTYDPSSGAGATDILITWIYKLTLNNSRYSYASVMSIFIFLIVGSFSFYNFRRTKAFKDDDF